MELATASRVTDWVQERFGRNDAITHEELVRAARDSDLPEEVKDALTEMRGGPWSVGEVLTGLYDRLLEGTRPETNTAGGLESGSSADYRWGDIDDVELEHERIGRIGESGRREPPEGGGG